VSKKDTIAQAQSGTGKTATFSIGILQLIDPKSPQCQAVVIAPTRELAQQINKVIFCFSEYMKVTSRCCIGGTIAKADKDALRNGGVQIVVGTPGRIKDLIEKKALRTDFIKIIVLDEADEMLSRGFVEEVKSIF
jgi:translation initiation factor 4A